MKKFAIIYLNEIKITKIDILRKQNEVKSMIYVGAQIRKYRKACKLNHAGAGRCHP